MVIIRLTTVHVLYCFGIGSGVVWLGRADLGLTNCVILAKLANYFAYPQLSEHLTSSLRPLPFFILVFSVISFFLLWRNVKFHYLSLQTDQISWFNGCFILPRQNEGCKNILLVQDVLARYHQDLKQIARQLTRGLERCEREVRNSNFDMSLRIFSELKKLNSKGILETRRFMHLLMRKNSSYARRQAVHQLSFSERKDAKYRSFPAVRVFDRTWIIEGLHDDVMPKLATILLGVEICEDMLSDDADRVRKELAKLHNMASSLEQELMQLYFKKHLDRVRVVGLKQAVREFVDSIEGCCSFKIHLKIEGDEDKVSDQAKLQLLGIIREAMINLMKHANPGKAEVELLFKSDRVVVTVADDGKGFALESGVAKSDVLGRQGLVSMKKRAQVLGGTLIIDTAPGLGTKVVVSAPINGQM